MRNARCQRSLYVCRAHPLNATKVIKCEKGKVGAVRAFESERARCCRQLVALCVDTPAAALARYKHIPGWRLGRRIKARRGACVCVHPIFCISRMASAFHMHWQNSLPAGQKKARAPRPFSRVPPLKGPGAAPAGRLFLHPHSAHTMPSARSTLLDRWVQNISSGVRNGRMSFFILTS